MINVLCIAYLVFLFFSFRKPYSKTVFFIGLAFLYFMIVSCTGHADYTEYCYMYDSPAYAERMIGKSVFPYLLRFLKALRLPYHGALAVVYGFIFFSLGRFIYKNCNACAFVLALYALTPYAVDMVQWRNTLAYAIVLFGIDLMMNDKRKGVPFVYLLLVGLASLLHSTVIAFSLLVLSRFLSVKKSAALSITFFAACIAVLATDTLNKLLSFVFTPEKINDWTRISGTASIHLLIGTILTMIGVFLYASVGILLSQRKKYGSTCLSTAMEPNEDAEKSTFVLKCVILMFSLTPIARIHTDVYRYMRYLILPVYVALSMLNERKEPAAGKEAVSTSEKTGILLSALFVVMQLLLTYTQTVFTGNFPETVYAIFTNNYFF